MKLGYRFVLSLARGVCKVLYRSRVYGQEHYCEEGAVIAANHTSYLDPPLLAISWPEEVHFLASEYLFKVPLFGALIRFLNSHPIERGTADLKSIKTICSLLVEGKKVIIFPEGRRSCDGKMAPLKPGISLIVFKANASIVPAYIHGAFDVWPRFKRFPKLWGKVAVVFGSPIKACSFDSLGPKERQKALIDQLNESIHALQKWYLQGAQGSPP